MGGVLSWYIYQGVQVLGGGGGVGAGGRGDWNFLPIVFLFLLVPATPWEPHLPPSLLPPPVDFLTPIRPPAPDLSTLQVRYNDPFDSAAVAYTGITQE